METPTYQLYFLIAKTLKPVTLSSAYNVKDSFSLVNNLHTTDLTNLFNHTLVSFDVILITPINSSIQYIQDNFIILEIISSDLFIELIYLIFEFSTFYNNRLKKQLIFPWVRL